MAHAVIATIFMYGKVKEQAISLTRVTQGIFHSFTSFTFTSAHPSNICYPVAVVNQDIWRGC